jgi:hypothetical protein
VCIQYSIFKNISIVSVKAKLDSCKMADFLAKQLMRLTDISWMLGKDWVVCQMLQKLLLQADTRMIPSVEIPSDVRRHLQTDQRLQVKHHLMWRLLYLILMT